MNKSNIPYFCRAEKLREKVYGSYISNYNSEIRVYTGFNCLFCQKTHASILDKNFLLTGNQLISGNKTFTDPCTFLSRINVDEILDNTPEDLQKSILDTFNEAPSGDRSKILTYFIENKLKELTDSIGDF